MCMKTHAHAICNILSFNVALATTTISLCQPNITICNNITRNLISIFGKQQSGNKFIQTMKEIIRKFIKNSTNGK